jgi:hypothetical protein
MHLQAHAHLPDNPQARGMACGVAVQNAAIVADDEQHCTPKLTVGTMKKSIAATATRCSFTFLHSDEFSHLIVAIAGYLSNKLFTS